MASLPLPHPGERDPETEATAFARDDAAEAETLLVRLAGDAIRCWRLDEATFWRRVKFRARLIRAAAARDATARGGE